METSKLKKHLRIDHDFEDDVLEEHLEWAEAEVKDSVSTSATRNESYFESNTHFNRAVILLTAHFFENRLPLTDVDFKSVPYGVMSAIQKLRGGYFEVEQNEPDE